MKFKIFSAFNIILLGSILLCPYQYAFSITKDNQNPSPFYLLPDLPMNNFVRALGKAPDGTIWVGNEISAIASYKDGAWTVHFEDTGHTDHKPVDFEFASNGDVWVALENNSNQDNGLRHYSIGQWEFIKYTGEEYMKLVNSVTLDKKGGLWLTTVKDGVYHFDGENWIQYKTVWPDTNGPMGGNTYEGVCDSNGNLWFVGGGGVSKYDWEKWTWYTSAQGGLIANPVYDVIIDKEGYFWFGTEKGVSRFDGVSEWKGYTTDDGLIDNGVGKIYQDSRGNFWFSGGIGVNKFDGKKWTSYSKEDMFNEVALDIVEAPNGDMWFALFKSGIAVLPYQADYPVLDISTDKGRYSIGDTITLSVEGENKGSDRHADIWLVMLDPAQNIYFALAWNSSPAPVIANIFFPAGFSLPKTTLSTFIVPSTLPPISNAGIYIFAVGLTDPGTLNFFHIGTAQFEVVP